MPLIFSNKNLISFSKFESNFGNTNSEREKSLKLLDKLGSTKEKSSKEKLHIDKAANKHIAREDNEK